MQVGSRSEIGHVRKRNEDALLVEPEVGVFAVADGMGGHPAGDVASAAAIRALTAELVDRAVDDTDPPAALTAALEGAHRAVREEAAGDSALTGMGTTVVVALVRGDATWVGHVGDSRAYLLPSGGPLRPVTRDHGAGGYLTQALGLDRGIAPDVVRLQLGSGDRLLLCSDGLTNMVPDSVLQDLLQASSDPQAASDALAEAALAAGGIDNVTVVVVAA
ncbi:MAG: family protein phosphatase [Actinomycetota bacterium]|jgi:serine/threonine protein phosphatase PrpC|nr:family protein phosphatase [Actinomycetota bacterium]MDQ1641248.1 family protein phosphatase [Actinomycetota bacterium]